jgi:hypothetical protein
LFCALNGRAQEPFFHFPTFQITTHQGLAQMQIRNMHQDARGFIWIATQGGLSRFDGQVVRSFYEKDGLPGGQIIGLTAGNDRIWGSTQQELFSFDGVEVLRYPLPGPTRYHLLADRNGYLWVSMQDSLTLFRDGRFLPVGEVYQGLKGLDLTSMTGKNHLDKVYLLTGDNHFIVYNLKTGSIRIDSASFNSGIEVLPNYYGLTQKEDDFLLFSRKRGSAHFDDFYRIVADTLQRVASYSASGGTFGNLTDRAPLGLYMQVEDKTHLYIRQGGSYKQVTPFPYNHIRFCMPLADRVLVATDDGLVTVFVNGLETYQNPFCRYSWSVAPFSGGSLLISNWREGVVRITKDGKILKTYPFPKTDDPAKYAQILSNYAAGDAVLFGTLPGFYWLLPGEPGLRLFELPDPVEALAFDAQRRHYLAAGKQFFYRIELPAARIAEKVKLPPEIPGMVNANAMLALNDGSVWVGGNGGLGCYNDRTQSWTTYTREKGHFPCSGVVSLETPDGRELWVGSSCGLYRFDDCSGTFRQAVPHETGRVSGVCFLPGDRLAFTTKDALFVVKYTGDTAFVTHLFDRRNGFHLLEPSENGMCYRGGFLWIPAANGIQRLELERLRAPGPDVRLAIDRIGGRQVAFGLSGGFVFPVEGASQLIDFSLINFLPGEYRFQASVNGQAFSQLQDSREILLPALLHGSNEIVLRATSGPDAAPCPDFLFTLDARLPFFQRRSTQVGSMLLVSLLVLGMGYYRHRHNRKNYENTELQQQLNLNRLKMIQAYLNPHFLFNTLTSIQNAILNKEKKEGNAILLSLSKLLRLVLDQGTSNEGPYAFSLVTLNQEIENIREYAFLESKQQSPPFQFYLEIDPQLDPDQTLVPPMILQPFVENAILHAFREAKPENTITISACNCGGRLQLTVADNGQGLHSAKQQQQGSRKSIGTGLVKERLAILRELGFDNQMVILPNQPTGTKITLTFQLIHESYHR